MLPIALKLAAAFLPDLIGVLTKSDKAEAVAAKVVTIATEVAGMSDPAAALNAIQRDPAKQAALQAAVDDNALELARIEAGAEQVAIKEWSTVVGQLAEADKAGASTRPKIALMMAWVVAGTTGATVIAVLAATLTGDATALAGLTNAWPLVLAMLAPAVALLRSYFGLRTADKNTRAAAALGQAPAQPLGALAVLRGAFKG